MNFSIVYRLILKDWYLHRVPIFAALAGGAVSMAIIAFAGKAGFILGLISLVTVLIAFGANLAMATIINEHKDMTRPFIMSLPISSREYTAAKILGNLLIYLLPWTILTVGSIAMLLAPHGQASLIPYVSIMSVEMLVSTTLVATVALLTDSQPWTIAFIMVGNLGFNVMGYVIAHIPSIAATMWGSRITWSAASIGALVAELISIPLLLAISFAVQARRQDWL